MKKARHRGVRSPPFVLPQFARAHAHLGAGWVWVDKAPDPASTCPIRAFVLISGDPPAGSLRLSGGSEDVCTDNPDLGKTPRWTVIVFISEGTQRAFDEI